MLLNKLEFGREIFPDKLLGINIKEDFERIYRILYFDNYDYRKIANLFFLSNILGFVAYLIFFPTIYNILSSDFSVNFNNKATLFMVNFIFIFIFSFLFYVSFILFLLFKYEFKYKKKEKNIENSLPDFLENLVSNLKGGIPIEKALIKSVRKDSKDLLEEIIIINERIMLGENVISALRHFRERFESPIISRTFFLIEEGLIGGGNIAKSIETIYKNLINVNNLTQELTANSKGFATIIVLIAVFLSPILFSIAIVLLTFLSNLFVLLSKNTAGSVLFSLKPVPSEFITYLRFFSYSVLGVISLFSSLIVAELKNEKIYNSIKYVPLFLMLSLIIYYFASKILLSFFSNII